MSKIIKLDKHLMNMIAAGEVVERPAGIVKELVENAIDANASVIEVRVKSGGIDYISVSDNGDGMSKEDALLAFERHATSKIKEESDLWSISTLGFRGEAIPSIASVAKVELSTNNKVDSNKIVVHYGDLVSSDVIAFNMGTKISVEGLFHKTPARLKSFNSPAYERAIISSTIEKFAFSYPNISFILISDDKEIFHTSGNDNLIELMFHVYGKDIAKNSILFENENSDFKVNGILALPSETRANRNHIQIFINDRMIRSYKISNDIIKAYRHLMFNDRYPIAVIKIYMDYQLVDVNVHPSKWEVRIAKDRDLSEFLLTTIKNALNANMEVKEVKSIKVEREVYDQISLDTSISEIIDTDNKILDDIVSNVEETIINKIVEKPVYKVNEEIKVLDKIKEAEVVIDKVLHPEFLNLRVIGQLHGKYILAESEDALYIIDQHAAEERSNFEKIRKQIMEDNIMSSELLIPVIINLKASQSYLKDKLIDVLNSVSIKSEEFSNNSIVVREVPLWLMKLNQEEFIMNIVEYIEENKNVSLDELRYDFIASKACKASIKFNHILSNYEISQLLDNLSKCESPHHCPHGRPTLIKLSDDQLIKEFMR